ncbi:MAG: DUF4351 domain-containing protein [Candidatus Solibacter usitatus]|nr:DUF4351 domain-containing protein [Candidatus Solibacter usitatus]
MLTGQPVVEWLNIELPMVTSLRSDLLALLADGNYFHTELQSENERDMPERLLLYGLLFKRRLGKFPQQMVLYVGEAPITMPTVWQEGSGRYEIVCRDIRDLDGDVLMASPVLENKNKLFGDVFRNGKMEGLAEGKAEGAAEGKAGLLLRLLTKRFGPLPVWVEERLASATSESLDLLSDRLLDAGTIDEIFR